MKCPECNTENPQEAKLLLIKMNIWEKYLLVVKHWLKEHRGA